MINVAKLRDYFASKRGPGGDGRILENGRAGADPEASYPDRTQVERLQFLCHAIPVGRDEINTWTAECAELIENLVLSRVSDRDLASILAGLVSYQKTGVTSSSSHQATIEAFCKTSGLFQEVLHYALFPRTQTSLDEPVVSPFFGELDASTRRAILQDLADHGYCTMPFQLPAAKLAEMHAALRTMALLPLDKYDADVPANLQGFDPSHPPKCGGAYVANADLARHATFSSLAHDPLITSIASEYLETPTSAIDSVLWYSFPSASAISELAQLYHYDLDTLRWLKVFYYLSDVTEENGPHAYIAGTHKGGAKSQALLDRGYVRIPDHDMDEKQPGTASTVTGPAGTVILGDTRAFHKGHRVRAGYRLIFSPIYAASKISYVHAA